MKPRPKLWTPGPRIGESSLGGRRRPPPVETQHHEQGGADQLKMARARGPARASTAFAQEESVTHQPSLS